MPFFGLQFRLETLHIGVVALDLSLEHVLIKAALSNLLFQLAVLGDQQLLLSVHFLDLLGMLGCHFLELFVQIFDLRVLGHERDGRLFFIALAIV